jgi:hypothetical protein
MSVDAYIEGLDPTVAGMVKTLRALVMDAAPQAVASVKWGQPVFEHRGPFAFIRPAARHVTLGFWRGTELSDPRGLLEGSGDRMRHV